VPPGPGCIHPGPGGVTDMYVRNQWYPAAAGTELGDGLLARRLLDQPLVVYRTGAGAPVVLADRCPHRFAPLSMGTRHGDGIECGYHGMRFGPDGACTHVPGQDRIPPGACVRAYPAVERYGLVWVWMGEPARADAARLPDIPQYGQPGWTVSAGYSRFGANFQNITDNLIDPAHTSFVRKRTIGSASGGDVPITTSERGDTVTAGRWVDASPPVPLVERFLPGAFAASGGLVDRWQFYSVTAPCVAWVDFGAMPAGRPHTAAEQAAAPFRVLSYGMLAPETAHSTHYFWFQLRNVAVGDAQVTAEFERLYDLTFEEDRVLLEAIEAAETAQPGMQPVRIASDAGLTRLRRMVARLVEQEQGDPAP
jgi:phenylpropionate dioxygenase-like ring-hydroxylating dioxygenase large terminal subunit